MVTRSCRDYQGQASYREPHLPGCRLYLRDFTALTVNRFLYTTIFHANRTVLHKTGEHRISRDDHHIAVVTCKPDNILPRNLEALRQVIQYIEYLFCLCHLRRWACSGFRSLRLPVSSRRKRMRMTSRLSPSRSLLSFIIMKNGPVLHRSITGFVANYL